MNTWLSRYPNQSLVSLDQGDELLDEHFRQCYCNITCNVVLRQLKHFHANPICKLLPEGSNDAKNLIAPAFEYPMYAMRASFQWNQHCILSNRFHRDMIFNNLFVVNIHFM
jgi:hypothetical protein